MIYKGNNRNLTIEPYEPCPCHLDKKFKFCCYQKAKKDTSAPMAKGFSLGRVNHLIREFYAATDFRTCFAFENNQCSGPIKNAHSLQNNRILNVICENGHLYYFKPEVVDSGPTSVIKKVGKNDASTFFGFCDFHDTELFKPIELFDYTGDIQQKFLFAFRALAVEMHKKLRQLENVKRMFAQRPRIMLDPQFVYMYRVAMSDVNDHQIEYELFKQGFQNGDYTGVRTIHRELQYGVKFAACSSFTVRYDINGKVMNDTFSTKNDRMPSIFLNIYPTPQGTTNILISYLNIDSEVYQNYFNSLDALDDQKLTKYLNYLVIENTENVFFTPSYIESLSENERKSFERSYNSSMNVLERASLLAEGNYYKFDLFNLAP